MKENILKYYLANILLKAIDEDSVTMNINRTKYTCIHKQCLFALNDNDIKILTKWLRLI